MNSQSFMWLAFGVAALVVALALAALLIRLRGTLGAVEELLDTTNEELKETLPEVRQTVSGPDHPVGKAIQDGVAAAKRKREELEASAMRKMHQATDGKE